MADAYLRKRQFYRDISGSLRVTVLDSGNKTLNSMTSHPNETIFVQKVHATITSGAAATTWSVQDSSANPSPLAVTESLNSANTAHLDEDYGANGVPITQGTDLVLALGNGGAAGHVEWEGYAQLTKVVGDH